MKTMKLLFTLLLVAGFATVGFGQGTIIGSAHDFQDAAWSGGEICIACHTPHGGDLTVPGAPLWNHEISEATYTPYPSGGTMNSSPGAPSAQSILCLSCHDGTVALDSYGGATGSTHLTVDSTTYVGIDLRDDHPISITYDAALATADGSLFDPTTVNSSIGGTIDADLLFGHQVQCASCHDVHGVTGTTNLLRITNDASELCLNCHNK